MKKTGFFIYFIILASSVFGQQFLWSTVKDTDTKYVSFNNVINEVLNFYDQYDYYYDFTGFDKEKFIEAFNGDSDDWDWIDEIKEKTVVAFRASIELGLTRGSAVYVICIGKDSVDMIIFSNLLDRGSNSTSVNRRTRFQNWFKTILN